MRQGEHSKSMTELYGSAEVQELITSIRKRSHNSYLFQQDYLKKKIKDCKLAFYQAGFANFEDMNCIAVMCLSNADIRKAVAKKFPVIFIDECQDLSANELSLLSLRT